MERGWKGTTGKGDWERALPGWYNWKRFWGWKGVGGNTEKESLVKIIERICWREILKGSGWVGGWLLG